MHSFTLRLRAGLCFRALMSVMSFCFALIAVGPVAAQTPTGVVEGLVSNLATQSNLSGVRVRVLERERDYHTERDGSYRIEGLPAGTYTLDFSYPGLDAQRHQVTVGGAPVRQDVSLTSGVYVLEKFTVSSEREGNAAAIAAQRNAANVQNVITADAFGNIAKGNVGDFLKRIPGIAGHTDEADTENIVLRGMAPEFTTLEIDGARMTGGGGGRNQSAASVPTDLIERVEVSKSPTPDTEADSMGGRINLITKSAYDRKGRLITFRAANSYSVTYGSDVGRQLDSPLAPSLAASYSNVFSVNGEKNNLGIHASVNWERILDIRGTTAWTDYDTPTVAQGGDGVTRYARFDNVSTALHGNDRGAVSLKADYRVSSQLSVGATLTMNTYTNRMFRTRNQLNNGIANVALSEPYLVVVDGAQYGTERSDRDRQDDRVAAQFKAAYRGDNGLKFETNLDVQRTRRHEETSQITALSNQRFNYAVDRREGTGDGRWPVLQIISNRYTGSEGSNRTTVLPDAFLDLNPFGDDFSNASSVSGQWQRLFSTNEQVRFKADLTKDLTIRYPVQFKTGVSYRGQSLKQWRDDLRGNVSMTGYGRDLRALLDDTWDLGGAIGRYPVGFIVDLAKVTDAMGISYKGDAADPIDRWNYDTSVFSLNTNSTRQNTLDNLRSVWEDIYGTYVQGSVNFGRLNVLGGVRYEQTRSKTNQTLRDQSLGGTLAEWTGRVTRKASYDNTFPSIHFRYNLTPSLQARLSYGTTSGRPNWGQILDTTEFDAEDHEISVPNLELKPRESENFDFSMEYYFEPVGVVSLGLFQKNITNYDVTFSRDITVEEAVALGAVPLPGDTEPWEISTRINAGTGRVRGIELNYSQQLSFLPGAFSGFGVFANYTYLKTDGTFDISGQNVQERTRLQKFIPRTANAGLSYNYNRYDLRLSWNYTSAWDENFQSDIDRTKVRGERWVLDFTGRYKLTRNLTVFLDLVNLTSNHGKKYLGHTDELLRNETNALGFLATAGISATF